MQKIKDQIVLICIDEAHVNLESQWGNSSMREDMYLAPSFLRAQVFSTTRAPVLAMTASAKVIPTAKGGKSELEQIKIMCSIEHSPTTVIAISPVLQNHNYIIHISFVKVYI